MKRTQFQMARVLCIPLILLYAWLAHQQVYVWRDTRSVWTNNLRHQKSTFSNAMRGAILYREGDLEGALRDFKLVDARPDTRLDSEKYSYLYTALGIMTAERAPEKALVYFSKVLAFQVSAAGLENLALIQFRTGRDSEAIETLYTALDLEPNNKKVVDTLTNRLFQMGRLKDAESVLRKALERFPQNEYFQKKKMYLSTHLANLS